MTGFSEPDLLALADLLATVGRAEILPRFQNLAPREIRAKSGPLDLVTDADVAAERAIRAGLIARFPGCLVVGEEACAADPALLTRLAAPAPDPPLAFVVDPIDGTANYAAGLPLFCSMVAAIAGDRVLAAAIHDPMTGHSFLARAGAGAFSLAPDGTRRTLRVAPPAAPAAMAGTISWRFLPAPDRALVVQGMLGLAGVYDFRCAGHHYCLLAAGSLHFSLYNRLLPWDHAPGVLLHREAGGFAARFDGSDYSPRHHAGGLICAPDRPSYQRLRAALLA